MKFTPLLLTLSLATSLRAMESEDAQNNNEPNYFDMLPFAQDDDEPNYFDTLPREMINLIAEFLAADPSTTLKDCNAFLRTCKRFNTIGRDAIINQDNVIEKYTVKHNEVININENRYIYYEILYPIHIATVLDAVEWVKKALEKDPMLLEKQTKRKHDTPLHVAAQYNAKRVAQLLIDKKANIHAESSGEYYTPLIIACLYHSMEVIQILLSNNALQDVKAIQYTQWKIASSNDFTKIFQRPTDAEKAKRAHVAQLLNAHKASILARRSMVTHKE